MPGIYFGSDAGEETVREIKMPQHFARSLSLADAMNPNNLLCYEMNGAPLPHPNGFPLRLIVPGYYSTYWVKALTKITAFLPGARGAALDHVTLGFRPMPMDGFPIVGRVPGAPGFYTVVTHSGVTLAPILGEYVRAELLGGEDVPMLAPYRPGRYAHTAS